MLGSGDARAGREAATSHRLTGGSGRCARERLGRPRSPFGTPKARSDLTHMKSNVWSSYGPEARFSFIDLNRLTVPRASSIELDKQLSMKQSESLSISGGSFMLKPDLGARYKAYLRASAGGGVFEIVVLPMEYFFLKAAGQSAQHGFARSALPRGPPTRLHHPSRH